VKRLQQENAELQEQLSDIQQARDAVSEVLFEARIDVRLGVQPTMADLDKYRAIHGRLANLLGVEVPREVEPAVESLVNENAKLRAIVDKIQKTADGVPVTESMTLWAMAPHTHVIFRWTYHSRRFAEFVLHGIDTDGWVTFTSYGPSDCFSTREAAEAAAKKKVGV